MTNEQPARVTVTVGYTRNMGNFESLRVDIGLEDSVRSLDGEGKAGIEAATARVFKFVEKKLIEQMNEVEEEINKQKKG